MGNILQNKKIAILIESGFEQVEMTEPKKALEEAGASTIIISKENKVKAWQHTEWGDTFTTDVLLENVNSKDYDALLLPGGVLNPDKLRTEEKAVSFVKEMVESSKPVAAICHGPILLIEAGVVKGRLVTSYPSIKTDLLNAVANWVDEEVVTDQGIVTSRTPADIPAFNKKMIEEFAEGKHERELINMDEKNNINF